jgi:methyl-accepting chemotaxis protein
MDNVSARPSDGNEAPLTRAIAEGLAKAPWQRSSVGRMAGRERAMRWYQFGLAQRLTLLTLFAFALVAGTLTVAATHQLDRDLTDSFQSKGEAIALAMASAAERSAKGDPLILQNAIEANRGLHGVAYILVLDPNGLPFGTTFLNGVPDDVDKKNPLTQDQRLNYDGDVNIVSPVTYREGEATRRAMDVAAPIGRLTLGTAHIGMDLAVVDDKVSSLRSAMIVWGVGVGLAGAAFFLLIIVIVVVRPVDDLTRVTSEIVRRGDLTQTIRVRFHDEIGELANTFRLMVEKLRELPKGIGSTTQIVASAVEKLNESVAEQGQTVSRQATALQETQVTAQEIKQTSLVASQKAEAVLQYAERADTVSKTGEAAVAQSLAALTAIRTQVEEITQRITRLGNRAVQIGNVTQTVKDLADQSNMLALNAAIEAVRSGEHGRGFAVVAREMRNLADQSIQGTKQVREMVDEIGAAIREAVAITEKGVQRIDAGLQQVKTSGDTLAELSGIVKDNSAAVRQISAAVGQQNAGITQIFGAVSDQTKMMDENVARLGATEQSLKALKDAASSLVALVEQFRV